MPCLWQSLPGNLSSWLLKAFSWLLETHLACCRELRTRFRSKDPVINVMFMQMALAIGREGRSIVALHLWSQQNELADDLSRASEGVLTPSCLSGVSFSSPFQGPWNLLKQAARAPLDDGN